jgi:hypothetical protein
MPWKSNPARGHAMGNVTDPGGGALDGAVVTITGPQNRTLKTDATGFFGAVDLPAGVYFVSISHPGRQAIAGTLTITGAQVAEFNASLPALSFALTAWSWNAALRRMTLTWNSEPGATYRIETSPNLQAWSTENASVPSAGTSTSYTTSTLPAGAARMFFRVRVGSP